MRTRDLQKVERKNIKYRENNRILSDAVQSLETRNITSAAGSGGNQNEVYVSYQHIIRETTEDVIENMDEDGEDLIQQQMLFNNDQQQIDPDEIIRPREQLYPEGQYSGSNPVPQQQNEGALAASGLFNHSSELNAGGRVAGAAGGRGYFDNAQDEATGGEGHSNINNFEEEKRPGDFAQQNN